MMKSLYTFIYFKWMKWKLIGHFPKELKKYIVIGVPHTHMYDLFLGFLIRKIQDTEVQFVAKKELFKGPLGWLLRKSGGIALDRTEGQNKVEAISKMFDEHDELHLTILPEGTRKKVAKWKTGFYYIAKMANVPIVMITYDYKNGQMKISEPFYTTDNVEADFKIMYAYFDGIVGKIPEYS